jgi:hypothetical protein
VKLKIAIYCLLAATFTTANAADPSDDFNATTDPVGRGINGFVTPVNQFVTPAGTLIELPGIRPLALALSPDGRLLVTAGLTHKLVVIDPATGKIIQHVSRPRFFAGRLADLHGERQRRHQGLHGPAGP